MEMSKSVTSLKKPTVKYDRSKPGFIEVGRRAEVFAVNHYNNAIFPNEWVSTSMVLSYDEDTGVFETRNTIYEPEAV